MLTTGLNKKLEISVIGMGYIGLPTATIFASAGYKVYGYDVDKNIIETLKSGRIHIVEPELQELVNDAVNKKNLIPTNEIKKSNVYIICVPTPFKKDHEKKIADLSYVESASREVGKVLSKGNIVILESTVPPKTTENVMGKILEEESGLKVNRDFYIAHCPERVLPGHILYEMKNNDRIIGASDKKVGETVRDLYASVVTGGNIYITNMITAEMCKLVENTYRDINIAFANELSILCDDLGIDVWELINLANKHPRVSILNPGPGVGGHCLAVDPWFIVEKFPSKAKLIKTAREINDYKTKWTVEKIMKNVEAYFENKKITIGILGLAYKPNTDDLRESPALKIGKTLKRMEYNVIACEPNSSKKEIDGIKNLTFDELLNQSDFLVYAVAHDQFKGKQKSIESKPFFDAVGVIR